MIPVLGFDIGLM